MEYNIHFDEIKLTQLVLHKVGNKLRNEGVRVASKLFNPDAELQTVLMDYFLGGFKKETIYEFNHEHVLPMNEIYNHCSSIFNDPSELFYETSIEILNHLYEVSTHPNIKGGELYVAYFKDCVVDDELVDAIGIFKAENKDTFLKLKLDEDDEWILYHDTGTNARKLDKGCLIFNLDKDTGYRVLTVDLKSFDAKFWKDDFLTITQIVDDRFQTQAYMDLCKDFSRKGFHEEDKSDRVEFLNRSKDYFENYKAFDEGEFKELIFDQNWDKRDEFEEFKQEFQEKLGIEDTADEGFFISKPAVKKAKAKFRGVIQLDTQMEIKVLSSIPQSEGFLERGYDEEKGMKYYKVYFNNEK